MYLDQLVAAEAPETNGEGRLSVGSMAYVGVWGAGRQRQHAKWRVPDARKGKCWKIFVFGIKPACRGGGIRRKTERKMLPGVDEVGWGRGPTRDRWILDPRLSQGSDGGPGEAGRISSSRGVEEQLRESEKRQRVGCTTSGICTSHDGCAVRMRMNIKGPGCRPGTEILE